MRPRLMAAAVAVAALSALAPAAAQAAVHAPAMASVQSSTAAAACTYKRSGNTWHCVTPGAYCPKAARSRYGYAKVTKKRYKCSQYTAATWRWKRT